jgi:SAM-dependent methyltransferase
MTMISDKAAERGNPSFVWRAGQERRLRLAMAHAPLADRQVLEFGCGLGVYMQAMRRCGAHVFGFDVEVERLQAARRAGVDETAAAVGERLPYADASFDVVFSNDVLEHVTDDAACAREIMRVLRPGGRAVIYVPNRLYLFETHGVYWRGRYYFGNKPFVNWLPDRWRNALAPHVRAYRARELRALFAQPGARIVALTQISGGFDNIIYRLGPAGRVLRAVMQGLDATPLRAFALEHLIVVERDADGR